MFFVTFKQSDKHRGSELMIGNFGLLRESHLVAEDAVLHVARRMI